MIPRPDPSSDSSPSSSSTSSSYLRYNAAEEEQDEFEDYQYDPHVRSHSHSTRNLQDRYDSRFETPEPNVLVGMWIGWSTSFYIFGFFSFYIWLAIITCQETRKSPFNVSLSVLKLLMCFCYDCCCCCCCMIDAFFFETGKWTFSLTVFGF